MHSSKCLVADIHAIIGADWHNIRHGRYANALLQIDDIKAYTFGAASATVSPSAGCKDKITDGVYSPGLHSHYQVGDEFRRFPTQTAYIHYLLSM